MSRWSFRFIIPNAMQFAEQTTGDLDRYQSRALTSDRLAQSLLPELWEVELAGGVKEKDDTLVARKGRLVQRVAAWNDATAKPVAEDWIYAARDYYAEALRAVGTEQGAARLGGALAQATSPAAVAQAARRARDRATRLPRVVTLPLLIVATDAYEDEPGIVRAEGPRGPAARCGRGRRAHRARQRLPGGSGDERVRPHGEAGVQPRVRADVAGPAGAARAPFARLARTGRGSGS